MNDQSGELIIIRKDDELTTLRLHAERMHAVLGEYVVLGKGKCTISKEHADLGLAALIAYSAYAKQVKK